MKESAPSPPRSVLLIVSAVTFLGFLDSTVLIPIMALYAAELGAKPGNIGLIIGLYSITNTPASIFFGRLIDRIGAKMPLIVGLIGDALSMFLYSLSRLPVHLALVRALHGASGGLAGPATMSIFVNYSGGAKGRVMSFYGMSLAAATLVGFGLSGIIASRFGYKILFFVGMAVLAVGAGLAGLLPGSRRSGDLPPKPTAAGFKEVSHLLRRKGLRISYGAIFAQYFTFGGVVTLLPLYLRGLGMTAFHMGMLLATFALIFIIIQFPSGVLSDRIGRRIPTAVGLSLGIISLVILPLLPTFPLLALAMALYGTAYGILFPSISALLAEHTVPEERGLATGIFHALLTAGVAIGAPIMGWVGGAIGIEPGLALNSGVMLLALVVVWTTAKT